jgi:hypothetical protein
MNTRRSTIRLAVIAAGAMVSLGVLGAESTSASPGVVAESTMSTGATTTKTTAPSTLPVPMARPSITGPAPLPPEEQGLPG